MTPRLILVLVLMASVALIIGSTPAAARSSTGLYFNDSYADGAYTLGAPTGDPETSVDVTVQRLLWPQVVLPPPPKPAPLLSFLSANAPKAIHAGLVLVHLDMEKITGDLAPSIYAEVYEQTAEGASNLIATTAMSAPVTSRISVDLTGQVRPAHVLEQGSRLRVALFNASMFPGSSSILRLYIEGDTGSRLEFVRRK